MLAGRFHSSSDIHEVTGVTPVQLGWTAYGHVDDVDRTSGVRDRSSGVGNVTLALKRNLRNSDGSGTSVAIMPYATFPAGQPPVGAGDWGAGPLMPASFEVSDIGPWR